MVVLWKKSNLLIALVVFGCDGSSVREFQSVKNLTNSASQSTESEVGSNNQGCQRYGTPMFGDNFTGKLKFSTISNGKCPLKDVAAAASMVYQINLPARSVLIEYCGKVEVSAQLDAAELDVLQSVLKNLKSIAPHECSFYSPTNAEFFASLTLDGRNYAEENCSKTEGKIFCLGKPGDLRDRFFEADQPGRLTRLLRDIQEKHLPK